MKTLSIIFIVFAGLSLIISLLIMLTHWYGSKETSAVGTVSLIVGLILLFRSQSNESKIE